MLTLVRRSLGRAAWPWAAVATLLAALQLGLVAAAASLADRVNFERLAQAVPGFVRDFLGGALTSFAGMVTIGYFEPVPVLLLVVLTVYLAAEPADEIETSLVDLVLARPLARHVPVTRTVLVIALVPATVAAVMALALLAGLGVMAPSSAVWPDARTLAVLTLYLLAVVWCFGAVTLAVAAFVRRRAAAVMPVGVGAVALYLLETLSDAWRPAQALAALSPFHYFPGAAVLDGRADPAADLIVLGGITLVATAVAYWQFGRRDL